MSDLIKREDAITAIAVAVLDDKDELEAIKAIPSVQVSGDLISRQDAIEAIQDAYCKPCKERGDDHNEVRCRVCEYDNAIIQIDALPSAEAVSMEEHIKELNDLAVEWKAKFAKAETITDEIYDETMAKVAKECEKCKERLRNIRPSAEAEPTVIQSKTLFPTKDFMEWAKRIKEVNPNAVVIPCDAEVASADVEPSLKAIKRQIDEHWYLDPPSDEAVQGEWTNEEGKPITDKFSVYCSKCKKWSEYRTNYCGHCGAKMKGGDTE